MISLYEVLHIRQISLRNSKAYELIGIPAWASLIWRCWLQSLAWVFLLMVVLKDLNVV